jgi:hypothetical protein
MNPTLPPTGEAGDILPHLGHQSPEAADPSHDVSAGKTLAVMVGSLLPDALGEAGVSMEELGYSRNEARNLAGLLTMYVLRKEGDAIVDSPQLIPMLKRKVVEVLGHMKAIRGQVSSLLFRGIRRSNPGEKVITISFGPTSPVRVSESTTGPDSGSTALNDLILAKRAQIFDNKLRTGELDMDDEALQRLLNFGS